MDLKYRLKLGEKTPTDTDTHTHTHKFFAGTCRIYVLIKYLHMLAIMIVDPMILSPHYTHYIDIMLVKCPIL